MSKQEAEGKREAGMLACGGVAMGSGGEGEGARGVEMVGVAARTAAAARGLQWLWSRSAPNTASS